MNKYIYDITLARYDTFAHVHEVAIGMLFKIKRGRVCRHPTSRFATASRDFLEPNEHLFSNVNACPTTAHGLPFNPLLPAQGLLFASILYLPVLFALLALDKK